MPFKIFNSFIFQGNFSKRNYFEGWYFRHTSAHESNTWSFIPGISLNKSDPHSFIQVIDGMTGWSDYVKYPLTDFRFDEKNVQLKVHDSVFTEDFIDISLKGLIEIKGRIAYSNLVRYPRNLLSPGIMGWYSYVPRMECKHGVVSVIHSLSGELLINGRKVDFTGGKGYIEKDWGTSFPEAWIWIQSNHFKSENASFFFSYAKIPWLGKFFMGFISYLYFDGRFYSFCTYNGSRVTRVRRERERIRITLANNRYMLHINCIRKDHGELKAPVNGEMSRSIRESINSRVSLRLLSHTGTLLFNDRGRSAGVEVIEKIFEYV
jgi:hypothetical protein